MVFALCCVSWSCVFPFDLLVYFFSPLLLRPRRRDARYFVAACSSLGHILLLGDARNALVVLDVSTAYTRSRRDL